MPGIDVSAGKTGSKTLRIQLRTPGDQAMNIFFRREFIIRLPMLGLFALLMSSTALAQSATDDQEQAADSQQQDQTTQSDQAATSAKPTEIEEIVVTARRREEKLQDVPGTVTALTEVNLLDAGVERAADFIAMTPGVSMVDAAEVGDTQVNIRGINGARDAENSFAYIVDGILLSNPAAFNREYQNLRQIEVFKGPQGAIYGRNAASGAIIVTTAKPSNDFEFSGKTSFAEDSTNTVAMSVSGPLIEDELFANLSSSFRESDGFFRNSFQKDDRTVDTFHGFDISSRVVWEPDDKFSLDTKIHFG